MIVGDSQDGHVLAVVDAVQACGGEPVVLDVERLRADGYLLTDRGLAVGGDVDDGCVEQFGRGWLRRLAPPGWARGGAASYESHDGVVRASWLALLIGWVQTSQAEWLTPFPDLLRAENKLTQLAVARSLGIDAPRTVSASSAEVVRRRLGERVLVKPLGPGQFVDATGDELMAPATVLLSVDLGSEVAACPFLFQEVLAARRHLRVVTVGSQAWAAQLDADELPVDWRLEDRAHDAFVAAADPASLRTCAAAVRLATQMNVRFSSQDWIDTGSRLVFLDLNPAGQWLFLPESVAAPVTTAIADWLSGNDPASQR